MDTEIIKAIAPLGAMIVAACGLFLAWRTQREGQLRKADVLKWALESIESLQTAVLLIDRRCHEADLPDEELATDLYDSCSRLSVLAEQGRLYFRNQKHAHGAAKEIAYRGLRPEILDQLIIGFYVCQTFFQSTTDERWKLRYLMLQAELRFVSLVQAEVGRSKIASSIAGASGDGVNLRRLLANIDSRKLENSSHRFRLR